MKKIVSLLLCMIMVFSVTVSATEDTLSSLLFMSDYQYWKGITNNGTLYDKTLTSAQPIVDKLAEITYENGYDIETVVIGGDYTQNDTQRDKNNPKDVAIFGEELQWWYGNDPTIHIAEIKEAIGNYYSNPNYILVQGNHEPDITAEKNYGINLTGAYEYDNYIIYVLNDQDYVGPRPRTTGASDGPHIIPGSIAQIEDPAGVVSAVADDLKEYLEKLIEKGETRPVFICSHQPLNYTTNNYNGNAHYIYEAINEAAKNLDIIFFFGHTHSNNDEIGGGLAYVAKGETMKICDDTLGENAYAEKTLNFTYLNYGFIARYSGTNGYLAATVVDITKDKILMKKYGAKDEILLAAYEIERINSAETIPSKITGTVDAKGEEKVLTANQTVTISNGGVLKNAIIDASLGSVKINGLTLTGKIKFNGDGKVGVNAGDTVKIVDGTTNTFLQKKTLTQSDSSYTMTVTNNTAAKSADVDFIFSPIYEGDVMFRLNITNIPETADLSASYK